LGHPEGLSGKSWPFALRSPSQGPGMEDTNPRSPWVQSPVCN
jgi:hypothetical protein